MKSKEYQNLIRDLPCSFCQLQMHGYVSWHHLTCVGNRGTGMKAPDYMTIPVCDRCHKKCHDFRISKEAQKAALIALWVGLLSNVYGEDTAYKIIGEEFWSSL